MLRLKLLSYWYLILSFWDSPEVLFKSKMLLVADYQSIKFERTFLAYFLIFYG